MTLAYSTEPGSAALPQTELCSVLRASTAAAHEQLEYGLALLSRVSDRQWFVHVLERFLGFHVVWEDAMRANATVRAFHETRSRLPHLRRDLTALGRTGAELQALPRCENAAELAVDPDEAVGSLYVMEGSTLGGQVISRALAAADWLPGGGLTYFHPYGERTGQQWRSFRRWADEQVSPQAHARAATGANRTFRLLHDWLTA